MSSIIHFFDWKRFYTSKTLCPTLHDPVLPHAVGKEQDWSHEHHGQSFSIVQY